MSRHDEERRVFFPICLYQVLLHKCIFLSVPSFTTGFFGFFSKFFFKVQSSVLSFLAIQVQQTMNCRDRGENVEVKQRVKEVYRWSESGKNNKLKSELRGF